MSAGRHSETAGSDLPARGKGVTVDNAKGETPRVVGKAKPVPPAKRPAHYRGKHEGRG